MADPTPTLTNLDANPSGKDGQVELVLTIRGSAKELPIASEAAAKGHRLVTISVAQTSDLYKLGDALHINGDVSGTGGQAYIDWLKNFVLESNGGTRDNGTAGQTGEETASDDGPSEGDGSDNEDGSEEKAEAAAEPLAKAVAPPKKAAKPAKAEPPAKAEKKAEATKKAAKAEKAAEPAKAAAPAKKAAEKPAPATKVAPAPAKGGVPKVKAGDEETYKDISTARTRKAIETVNELGKDRAALLTRLLAHESPMIRKAAADRLEVVTGDRPEKASVKNPGIGTLKAGTVLHHKSRSGLDVSVVYKGGKSFEVESITGGPKGIRRGSKFEGASNMLRALRGLPEDAPPATNLNQFFGLSKRRAQA